MRRNFGVLALSGMGLLILGGCLRHADTPPPTSGNIDNGHYQRLAKQIEYPDHATDEDEFVDTKTAPMSIRNPETADYLDLTLEQVMNLALSNSTMMRELGATVLRTPDSMKSKKDPSIIESDPRFGIEGALAAYDANLTSTFSYEDNNRAYNNIFFGGGTRLFRQNLGTWQSQLSKTTATGTQFGLSNYTQYDANNAPGNEFAHSYTTWYDMTARQPLWKNRGVKYNRLAGPNAQPGLINGVMIARINSDISLADFESGVRNFASDVENTYWDLYYAYRDLDAKISARNAALDTWRRIRALYERGRRGGEAEKEAQAREQYYRFEEDVQNSLHGRLFDGTRTANGSLGGTFRGAGGIYVVERRMRLLTGMPINDGRLIRPADEPIQARIEYDWEVTLIDGLTRRPELRRQKWLIKKREAELEANKNFLKPQLDFTGRYRFRGFGESLFPSGGGGSSVPFNNAYDNMLGGNFQEWQVGLEFSMPVGYRQAYAAVRHSEIQLLRERALLREQERQVVHELSNAVSDSDRAYVMLETNINRRIAAAEQVAAVQTAFENDNATLDTLLDSQRRFAEAELAYYRSRVEYQLSIKNVQFERGTLLEYNEIHMNEGAWPDKAYDDAEEREYRRGAALQYKTLKRFNPWVSVENSPNVVVAPGEIHQPVDPVHPVSAKVIESNDDVWHVVPMGAETDEDPTSTTKPKTEVETAEFDEEEF